MRRTRLELGRMKLELPRLNSRKSRSGSRRYVPKSPFMDDLGLLSLADR